jgi:hypothetical protein
VVPLRIIYVWPAFALAPLAEALAMPPSLQLSSLSEAISPLMAGLTAPVAVLRESAAGSDAPDSSAQAPDTGVSRPAPSAYFAPHEGGMSLLVTVITVIAALAGVVALARLAVGEDLFSRRWLH